MPRITLVRLLPLALIALAACFWKQGQTAWHVQSLRFAKGRERERHLDAIEKLGEAAMPQFSRYLSHCTTVDRALYRRAAAIFHRDDHWQWVPDRLRVRTLVQWTRGYESSFQMPTFPGDEELGQYWVQIQSKFGSMVSDGRKLRLPDLMDVWNTCPASDLCASLDESLRDPRFDWRSCVPRYDEWPPGEWYPHHVLGSQVGEILLRCLSDENAAAGARAFAAFHLSQRAARKHSGMLRGISGDRHQTPSLRIAAAAAAVAAGDTTPAAVLKELAEETYNLRAQGIPLDMAVRTLARRRLLHGWQAWPDVEKKHRVYAFNPVRWVYPDPRLAEGLTRRELPHGLIRMGDPRGLKDLPALGFEDVYGLLPGVERLGPRAVPLIRQFTERTGNGWGHKVLGAMGDTSVLPFLAETQVREAYRGRGTMPHYWDLGRIQAIIRITGGSGIEHVKRVLRPRQTEGLDESRHFASYALAAAGSEEALRELTRLPQRILARHWTERLVRPCTLLVDMPRPELAPLLLASLMAPSYRQFLTVEKLPLIYIRDPSVTQSLIGHLGSVRHHRQALIGTLMILGLRGDRSAIRAVRGFATSKEEVVRDVARCSLAALGAESSREEITRLLDSPSRFVRASAYHALAVRWPEAALPLLLEGMRDVSVLVVRICQMSLAKFEDPSIAPALEAMTDDFFLYEGMASYRPAIHDDLLLALAHARSPKAPMLDLGTSYPYLLDRLRMTSGYEAMRFAKSFEALSGIEIGYEVLAPRREQVKAIEKAEQWWRETRRPEER